MIDKIDISILEIMQKDGRASVSDVAKAVKLSIPAAGERIKKLSERGFLQKIVAILDCLLYTSPSPRDED